MIKRALISVYDKTGILELAKFLAGRGVEIISTGGTYKYLKQNGIEVIEVSEVTGHKEMLDGRVKTLHPVIHAGILAMRNNEEHMETLKEEKIETIDMVVVNLYPFFEKVNESISFDEKVEFIDIGGPTMIRASAKNFKDVIVLTDAKDYQEIISQIQEKGTVDCSTRKYLAGKVFNLMSAYDAAISNFLLEESYPEYLTISYRKNTELRYGENPHQTAAYYASTTESGAMRDFIQLGGKELSYNNIKDMDIAWKVVNEFEETACCAVKHNSPCGAAVASDIYDAYVKTFECDPISIFGGIVAFNKRLDEKTAAELTKTFLEIIIAPGYDEGALRVLESKKNLRIIQCDVKPVNKMEMTAVDGGILVQSGDNKLFDAVRIMTDKKPSDKEIQDMLFGMKVVKYVKSNAIVIVRDGQAIGIGGGQVNRIWAAAHALNRGKEGTVLVSDAFFPFGDIVEEAAKYNIKAIMQPGGSVKDSESIEACNRHGISMIFTGVRHFKH